jgi:hypothetical protein
VKKDIIGAAIIALGLIVGGFFFGGRYDFVNLGKCVVARGDRWTGEVETESFEDCEWNF